MEPRRCLLAAFGLVICLSAVACGSAATASPDVTPATSPPPSATPIPRATPTDGPAASTEPTARPSVVPLDWVEVARVERARVQATIESEDGLVAVGCALGFEQTESAAWWDCTEAAAWTWSVHGGLARATVEGADGARMWDVAAVPGGFIAFGGDVDRESFRRAVLWRSTDGTSWDRVDDPTFEARYVADILPWDGGLLAIGGSAPPAGEYGGFAVWRSTDGMAWDEVPITVGSDLAGGGVFGAVVAGERLVAWGRMDAIAYAVGQALVLRSEDGETWERVPSQPSLDRAEISSIIVYPGGDALVAAGAARTDDETVVAAAWTSTDGLTWTRGSVPAVVPEASIVDLGRGVEGLIARGPATTWTSTDGSAWTALPAGRDRPDVADTETLAPVRVGGGRVVFGFPLSDLEDEDLVPTTLVWMSPSAGP